MTDAYASQDRYIATLGCVDEMAFLNLCSFTLGHTILEENLEQEDSV